MVGAEQGFHRSFLREAGTVTLDFSKQLSRRETTIPGLVVFDIPVHGDNRGWFKENWQREKMTALGLEDFGPVQNNISFNDAVGTTRGIHAEPWDKYVSVAAGRIFGAWVDLREGSTFGAVYTTELDPSRAIFVPRGVANSFQTLEADTVYSYLVNDHWSPDAEYSFVNLADETLAIEWPIPLDQAEVSAKDLAHPRLADATPIGPRKTLVVGANGQLGKALRVLWASRADVEFASREDFDLTKEFSTARRWRDYGVIVNAAAYTAVDTAEGEGRADAWNTNALAVARLASIASAFGITLVHISSDYVFDGTLDGEYTEAHPMAPLGAYGQSKAAGDLAAQVAPRHYVIRVSWVIGDGKNFVNTMASLATRGINPRVVDDQRGRLTFTQDIAAVVEHLLSTRPAYGTYNVTSSGASLTWAEIAKEIFAILGHDPERVSRVSTSAYYEGVAGPIAQRPSNSQLALTKIEATGFQARDQIVALADFLRNES